MQLIILDDTPAPYPFMLDDSRVRYVHDNSKHYKLWEKRNKLNEMAEGDIIVCMDDDDYNFPKRVELSTETLLNSSKKLAGGHNLYIYDLVSKQLYHFKTNRTNVLLNGTFAYKKALLEHNKYSGNGLNCLEEKNFTKNFSEDSEKLSEENTIICCSHGVNTVDKSKFCNTSTAVINSDLEFNLNTMFDANPMLYWINLEECKDRYENMMKQLKGFKYKVRIRAMSQPDIRTYNTKLYSKSQMSCLCSHLKAMRVSLQDKDRSYAVICEDDIDLKRIENFHEIIFYYIKSAPINWDVLQLFWIKPTYDANKPNKQKEIVSNRSDMLVWERWTRHKFSTLIYIIRKEYMKKLLISAKSINVNTKHLVADEFIYNKGKTYSITVPYFVDDLRFDSMINKENRMMHQRNKEFLIEQSKSIEKVYPFE
jgi:GR25 family glycosyltransferase involved in LPS biosynthesis